MFQYVFVGLSVYAAMLLGWRGMGMGVHSLFASLIMQVKQCAALFGDADNVGNVNDDIDILSVCRSWATCFLLEIVGLCICLLVYLLNVQLVCLIAPLCEFICLAACLCVFPSKSFEMIIGNALLQLFVTAMPASQSLSH